MFVTAGGCCIGGYAAHEWRGSRVGGSEAAGEAVGRRRLRMVQFKLNGRMFEAIEPESHERHRIGDNWHEKHQVVRFRDVVTHKYVAVAVDGEITEYGRS